MDVAEVIQKEMRNVLTALEKQTTRSLDVIKSTLDQNGLPIPPDFKQNFLQASSKR